MRIAVTFSVRVGGGPSGHSASSELHPWEASDAASEAAELEDDEQEEFDSPQTIQALACVLEGLGHDVDLLGEGEPMLRRLLSGPRPDLVLNIAEGAGGSRTREARVPAVLEMLDIPYTGSDPLTLAATLDKDFAKRLVAASGVSIPPGLLFAGDMAVFEEQAKGLAFPAIVKPAYEGSSKGILATSVVYDWQQLCDVVAQRWQVYRQAILVEEFIDGDELTVGIVGNRPPEVLGIMRVVPRQSNGPFVYSLEVKRDYEHQVRYECPAQLAPQDIEAVHNAALACWNALGCRDVARIDFRLRDGVPYFLEANPLPGLSPVSGDLVIMAGLIGIDYPELIARILQAATERLEQRSASLSAR